MSSPYSPGEALVGGQCISHWISCQAAQMVLVSSHPSGPEHQGSEVGGRGQGQQSWKEVELRCRPSLV